MSTYRLPISYDQATAVEDAIAEIQARLPDTARILRTLLELLPAPQQSSTAMRLGGYDLPIRVAHTKNGETHSTAEILRELRHCGNSTEDAARVLKRMIADGLYEAALMKATTMDYLFFAAVAVLGALTIATTYVVLGR